MSNAAILALIFAPLLLAWVGLCVVAGLDHAKLSGGRYEAIGNEGGYGPVFLGYWSGSRPWGVDFAFRVRFWPNRGAWTAVSVGPMFGGIRFRHRRFEFRPRCQLTGILAPGLDVDRCCSICELGRNWPRQSA